MGYNPNNNPYVPGDPYMYDLNWIVAKINELVADYAALQGLPQDFTDLYNYVHDYFDNLDISAELDPLVQQAIANGDFDAVIYAQVQALAPDIKNSSNTNLLDNPWFTVNQRGVTTGDFSSNVYRMDRWKTLAGTDGTLGSWTLSSGTLTITNGASAEYFYQIINDVAKLNGRKLTASALLSDDTIVLGTITRAANTSQTFISDNGLSLAMPADNTFRIGVDANTTKAIKAVKLEIGELSTLDKDVAPDYPSELDKCRWYCRVYENAGGSAAFLGIAYGSGYSALMPIYSPMRTTPSASYSGTININKIGSNTPINGLQASDTTGETINLSFSSATALTNDEIYRIMLTTGAKIILSADL